MIQRELLRAGVELYADGAAVERPLGLGERVAVRVEPAEREQAAVAGGRLLDDHVVRRRVPLRLVHREDERPRVDLLERADELLSRAPVAVGIIRADVR